VEGTRTGAGDGSLFLCDLCRAPLAYDQRYCVDCGTRRDPLPAEIAALISLIAAGATGPSRAPAESVAPLPRHDQPRRGSGVPPASVCAATLAAICALGLGVVAGNAAGPAHRSALDARLLAAVSQSIAVSREHAGALAAAAAVQATASATAPTPIPIPIPSTTPAAPTPTPAPTPAVVPVAKAKSAPKPTKATPAPVGVPAPPPLPSVNHIFLVMLTDTAYDAAFGPTSASRYLAQTLPSEGELLPNYYAVASGELANEIAVISGQGPTPQTAVDCPQYTELTPSTLGTQGQTLGSGCVYPPTTKTLLDELSASGDTWKTYAEDAGNGGPGVPATCRHPALGAADPDQTPLPGDAYVTWGDPTVYFHSVIDTPACATDDVGLDQLTTDLKTDKTTPSFAYIVPNRCHDGSAVPCAPGAPAGLGASDAFLRTLVPEIMASPAYKNGGLIAITFDQAPQTGPGADSTACCGTPAYPNLAAGRTGPSGATGATGPTGLAGSTTGPNSTSAAAGTPAPVVAAAATGASAPGGATTSAGSTGTTGTTGTTTGATGSTGASGTTVQAPITATGGGGRVGLLLISQFVKRGSVNQTDYNHFSLLASVQDLFSLPNIGYAGSAGLPVFDTGVYNAKG
jgi:hypothetical protein